MQAVVSGLRSNYDDNRLVTNRLPPESFRNVTQLRPYMCEGPYFRNATTDIFRIVYFFIRVARLLLYCSLSVLCARPYLVLITLTTYRGLVETSAARTQCWPAFMAPSVSIPAWAARLL